MHWRKIWRFGVVLILGKKKRGKISFMWFGYMQKRPLKVLVRRVDEMNDNLISRGRRKLRKIIDKIVLLKKKKKI